MGAENPIQMKVKSGDTYELLYPYTKAEYVKYLKTFSFYKVGDIEIAADNYTSTLDIVAGNNINIVADNVNKRITISSSNIEEENPNFLHVTQVEKTTWNGKENVLDSIKRSGDALKDANKYTDDKILNAKIPINISQLVNDSKYTNEDFVTTKIAEAVFNSSGNTNVDLSGYATKNDLLNKSDTTHWHQELHSHNNINVISNITSENIISWNSKSEFNGSYNALTNKPTIPTLTSQLLKDDVYNKTQIDNYLSSKVDKILGKNLSTNDFTTEYKSKLDGLRNYTHPDDANTKHVTNDQIAFWNSKSGQDHNHIEIGSLRDLQTANSSDLVNAINSLVVSLNELSIRVTALESV